MPPHHVHTQPRVPPPPTYPTPTTAWPHFVAVLVNPIVLFLPDLHYDVVVHHIRARL